MPVYKVEGEMTFEIQVEAASEKDVLRLLGLNLEATIGCSRCRMRAPQTCGWDKDTEYMEVIDYNYDVEDFEIEEEDPDPRPICSNCNGEGMDNIYRCGQCNGLGYIERV